MKLYNMRLEEEITEELEQGTYNRLSNFLEMSKKETSEIENELSKLNDEDLKIVKIKIVKL